MKNVLLINGAKVFGFSEAKLSASLCQVAFNTLNENGFKVEQTIIDEGYEPKTEVEKILRADIIIFQVQGFWMNAPWIVWEYFAKVFKEGAGNYAKTMVEVEAMQVKNTAQVGFVKIKNL